MDRGVPAPAGRVVPGVRRFYSAATARGLYATAEFAVPGQPDLPPAANNWVCEAEGWRFTLAADAPLRARAVVNLALTVESVGARRPVLLEPVMAPSRTSSRSTRREADSRTFTTASQSEPAFGAPTARMTFQVQIPDAGRYVIWSQVKIDGQERFAPFWIAVEP